MLDQLSPIAPARIRAVLLPIGQIKRARFQEFVERLRCENVVQLGDVSPDGRPHRNMFSPLAFPPGRLVYDLATTLPPANHLALAPFENYREPLVIIALADGVELSSVSYRGRVRRSLIENGNGPPRPEHNLRELYQDLEDLRDRYPKALVHQLMLFDYVHKSQDAIPEGIVAIPPPEECKITTIRTIMCDLSSLLLAEMTTLAKSLQALHTIESPSQTTSKFQHGESSWRGDNEEPPRSNSRLSISETGSRTASPAGIDRSHVRMSMPVQLRRNDSDSTNVHGRSASPMNGLSTPATTFEDIVGTQGSESRLQPKNIASRLAIADSSRDSSRDRVSISGFGSNSVSERARNKGKGRIGVVIGSLYLQAGRWNDAIKELTEATQVAKVNLDHIWHAKALDNIVVALLMLAWTGLDFQIPNVCFVSDKSSNKSSASSDKLSAAQKATIVQNLATLLPELLDRILNLYTRAANNTGEYLPQYSFSESTLRFSKLLTAIHLSGGSLYQESLESLVCGTSYRQYTSLHVPRLHIRPSRTEIVSLLHRALPLSSSLESLSLVDRVMIMSGVASVLGSIGCGRKKAMIVREVVSMLIPGLVQARIKGAAELGVHPAAGLAALSAASGTVNSARTLDLADGDVESGIDVFLGLLSDIYGTVTSACSPEMENYTDEAILSRIERATLLRAFGGQNLKMDILRSCINLCEALPDFSGVLRFTADLLRTAGSGIAPGPRTDSASPLMTRDEQIRLSTNIARTIGAARNLGIKDITAEYWDEFLVRGIEVDTSAISRAPVPHKRTDLPGATPATASKSLNPFIYNPFLKQPDTSVAQRLLIAGEVAHFKVTLQNPYEFDVEVESIKLETSGPEFEAHSQKTVIGPYRTQILSVSGTPHGTGDLKITGCVVKIRGCTERRFPVFVEPWSPQKEVKIKRIGVSSLQSAGDRPRSIGQAPSSSVPLTLPVTSSLTVNVIDKQPVVTIAKTSLFQSALMVLEGERQTFTITLQNTSKDTAVDFVLLSFKDSTQPALQAAMANRETSPAELYEHELVLTRRQALKWKRAEQATYIAPGDCATFDIEVLGRAGLTNATVQIDYAHLGVSKENYPETFYTRQLHLPLTITVNASVELIRMDVLPLTGSIPKQLWLGDRDFKQGITASDYCLLVLDLRDTWPSKLHLQLEVDKHDTVEEELSPGATSRIMFPIRKIFLKDPAAAIPTLDPSRQRQFVVSASRVSADSERANREAFWYREEILGMLRGTWATGSDPKRRGEVELRGIRLSQRMIDALKVDDVGIELFVQDLSGIPTSDLLTDVPAQIRIRITNRSVEPVLLVLRVQPTVRNQPHNIALDLSKKFVWNGILQQPLPVLGEKESMEVILGVTPLCRGNFDISVSAEEARVSGDGSDSKQGAIGGDTHRPRANTGSIMDSLLGAKDRRIWHTREPCLISVRDDDSSDDDSDDR